MAVWPALSTCCMSAVKSGHKVLVFGLAKRRTGVFFLRVFLPGSEDVACLLRQLSKLHTPSEAGRPWLTYWLGAAQHWVGSSCPMRCDDLSHLWKWPLALVSYANQISLSLVTASSRFVSTPCSVTGVSSPVEPQGLGRV